MATKLVSANMGIVLVIGKDGKQIKKEWSAIFPTENIPQPYDALFYLKRFLEDSFETDIEQTHVPIAKPRKIKARRQLVTQEEFVKRIKELSPQ